ncbi:MAG: hypothetical protein WDA59_01820 [Methanofastidiosum sp.]
MSKDEFVLIPEDIPPRKKSGRYRKTVDSFIASNKKSARIPMEEGVQMNSVYSGFNRVIKDSYSDKVNVRRIDGELYIEKL